MGDYEDRMESFFADFGKGRKMVLSTSENDRVSSRMMSVVRIDGEFYFQTDRKLRKYHQLSANPHVALCIDNIQIEGSCRELARLYGGDNVTETSLAVAEEQLSSAEKYKEKIK